MCTLLGDQAPTAEEWADQGLDKYGVIAVLSAANGGVAEAAQVEKVSHETATQMLEQLGTIKFFEKVGDGSKEAALLFFGKQLRRLSSGCGGGSDESLGGCHQ